MEFYRDVLGLKQIDRPPFDIAGAWLEAGPSQVHLIDYPRGTYRDATSIDNNDIHFALRVGNFDETLSQLVEKGFSEDKPEGDPLRLLIRRKGLAGFPQLYLLDPDRHVIEINSSGPS